MKSRLFSLSLLAVLVFGALATSCSKEQKLLEAVPSDVQQVGMFRLKSVMEQAGCKFDDNGVTAPEWAKGGSANGLVGFADCLEGSKVCDINELAWAVKGRSLYMTMLVKSKDEFVEATANVVEWGEEESGYKVGEMGDIGVLVNDERVWLDFMYPSHSTKPVDALKEFIKPAEKESVAALTGIASMLESDNLVNIAVRQSPVPASGKAETKGQNPELQALWSTAKLNIKDNKIVATSEFMKADGEVAKIKGLQPVNPAVLAYIPASCNIALAFGLTPEFDWSMLTSAAIASGGFQMQGMVAAVTPYLQAIDGTVMIAAGPANDQAYSDIEPGNWHFILMAHMTQEKINSILDMIRSTLFMNRVTPATTDDGVMVIPQYGMNFYVGNVDGYLGIANFPFNPNQQNELSPLFNGKDGALSIDLPSLKLISPMAPEFGVKVTSQFAGDKGSAEITLPGMDEPILQAILKAFMK